MILLQKKRNSERYLEHEIPIEIKDIKVIPFLIDHSAYDSYAFLIQCDGEKIVYSSDFRIYGAKGRFTEHRKNRLRKV